MSEAQRAGGRRPRGSHHHAPPEQPGNDHTWLTRSCEDLLRATAGEQRGEAAARLGARAADEDLPPRDLVDGVFAAAGRWWSTPLKATDTAAAVHTRSAALLESAHSVLSAAMDGYLHQARSELVRHRTERAAFVDDLLTGRAEPGRLAERAHRYGIRLSATHTVLVARAPRLTADIVRRIDAALAARFGEGNTLTTLHDGGLVCISAAGLFRRVAPRLPRPCHGAGVLRRSGTGGAGAGPGPQVASGRIRACGNRGPGHRHGRGGRA
ncbi:hypothetical protein QLR68_07150 [Micromonospora sp. DH15]|nr:hypothetical protein [Micromonospora sp. DH15]